MRARIEQPIGDLKQIRLAHRRHFFGAAASRDQKRLPRCASQLPHDPAKRRARDRANGTNSLVPLAACVVGAEALGVLATITTIDG